MTSSATRVAVLSDVHGNAVALAAVLRELAESAPDLMVFGGDLTWGPLPEKTRRLLEPLVGMAVFVRGNAERALSELGRPGHQATARERWLLDAHSPRTRAFLDTFVDAAVVDIAGLGPTRFCHGSPRSDEELITDATPAPRMRALLDGMPERVLVSAHTHLQFDRTVAGVRSINAGSVGMPYGGRPGAAYWALLGGDVELRQTDYDLAEAVRAYRASGDPLAEQMVETLVAPPSREEVVAHAEALEFSG